MFRILSVAVIGGILSVPTPSLSQAAQPQLVVPKSLLKYSAGQVVNDYRPAINFSGTRVVFERSTDYSSTSKPPGYIDFDLQIADLGQTNVVKPLIGANNRYGVTSSARADWCWARGQQSAAHPIAFSVGEGIIGQPIPQNNGVYVIDPDNPRLSFVPGSIAAIYPTWYPACQTLAVDAFAALPYKYQTSAGDTVVVRGPQTQRINPDNGALQKALSGARIWAGFANVNQVIPTLVVVAGQRFSETGYDQNMNYIYVADTSADPPRVWPLEHDASATTFDPAHQGRAPTWSPDGKWIAFESTRNCKGGSLYALFLKEWRGPKPPQQLTACKYNGQHAKWYPAKVDGRTLIVASFLLAPTADPKTAPAVAASRGIASIDVTDFVQAPAAP